MTGFAARPRLTAGERRLFSWFRCQPQAMRRPATGPRRKFGERPAPNAVANRGDEISLGKARVFQKRLHNRSSWKKCKGWPQKPHLGRAFAKPSDGLEPSTPPLPDATSSATTPGHASEVVLGVHKYDPAESRAMGRICRRVSAAPTAVGSTKALLL